MTLSALLQRCRGQGFPPWLPAEKKKRSNAGVATFLTPLRSHEGSQRPCPERTLISYRFRRRLNKNGASGGAPAWNTIDILGIYITPRLHQDVYMIEMTCKQKHPPDRERNVISQCEKGLFNFLLSIDTMHTNLFLKWKSISKLFSANTAPCSKVFHLYI